MARKGRSQRRKNRDGDDVVDGGSGSGADADFLSESHTIATHNSMADSSVADDDSWGIEDDIKNGDIPSDSAVHAAEQRHQKLLDALSTFDDYPTEKRTAKREQLLKGWFRAFTMYATSGESSYEPILERRDDLLRHCRFGIRQGSPSEQYAACRVLEAAAVLIGNDASYYEALHVHLTRIVTSAHRAVPVRAAALRALGMAVFIGVDDDHVTESVMDLCESLANKTYRGDTVPSNLRAAALEVWNVLATTIHHLYIAGKDDVSTGRGLLLLPLLFECLEQTEDSSLRSSAGESVAWIHTARLELGAIQAAEEDGVTQLNTTQKQYQQGSWEGSDWEDIMADILQVIDQLSNQSGHYMSKKAKKEQRANFREYLATIQDNESPHLVVQFRGGSLELESWKDIIPLNFVRRCLQGGFQIQLLTNPTLQAIFGATGNVLNANSSLSQLEKRLLLSKTSEAVKLKNLDRHKDRDKRRNIKNHFLTADGDDNGIAS